MWMRHRNRVCHMMPNTSSCSPCGGGSDAFFKGDSLGATATVCLVVSEGGWGQLKLEYWGGTSCSKPPPSLRDHQPIFVCMMGVCGDRAAKPPRQSARKLGFPLLQ